MPSKTPSHLYALQERMAALEDRIAESDARAAALASDNKALRDELDRSKPAGPKPEPLHIKLPGGGGWVNRLGGSVFPTVTTDRAGNEITTFKSVEQLQEENRATYEASLRMPQGGPRHRSSSYITRPDGTKVFAPDGQPRNEVTGELLCLEQPNAATSLNGPVRTYAHQQSIDLLDPLFPVTPIRVPDDE